MTSKVKNVIWMIWKSDEGESFKVGELSKRPKKYYFKYDLDGVKKAEKHGFSPLPYFPIVDVRYFSERLFRSFSKRLPGNSKKDISSILKEYDLEEYDDLELLVKSGGKMPTDSFEFRLSFDGEGIVLEKEGIVLEKEGIVLEKEGIVLEKEGIVLEKEDIVLEKEGIVLEEEDIVLEEKNIVLEEKNIVLDEKEL